MDSQPQAISSETIAGDSANTVSLFIFVKKIAPCQIFETLTGVTLPCCEDLPRELPVFRMTAGLTKIVA
jgi:hypothetical protein